MTWVQRLGGREAITAGIVAEFRALSARPHGSGREEAQGAYLLEKPSGEVKALAPAQSSAALTQQEKEAAALFGTSGAAQSAAGENAQAPASQVNTQPAASEVAAGQAEDVLAQTAGAWPTE